MRSSRTHARSCPWVSHGCCQLVNNGNICCPIGKCSRHLSHGVCFSCITSDACLVRRFTLSGRTADREAIPWPESSHLRGAGTNRLGQGPGNERQLPLPARRASSPSEHRREGSTRSSIFSRRFRRKRVWRSCSSSTS